MNQSSSTVPRMAYDVIVECCLREQALTVLFADIQNFTTLNEAWPVRAVVNLLNEFYGLAERVMEEEHGHIFKYLGDGILAAFGDPVCPPMEVARARRAALKLVARFQCAAEAYPFPCPGLGIGLARGTVMLSRFGSASAAEFTIIGDTVNTASRLASLAEQGQVLATEGVIQLLQAEEYVFLGNATLRGKAAPFAAYRLVIPSEVPGAPPGGPNATVGSRAAKPGERG